MGSPEKQDPAPLLVQDAERACERLMVRYARMVDAFDVDGFADLFTEDAELVLPAGTRHGREAIRRGFARRDPALISRHVLTNLWVTTEGEEVLGGCYLTLFRNQVLESGEGAADPLKPALIGEYRDRYRRTEGRWRIARRELIVVFRE